MDAGFRRHDESSHNLKASGCSQSRAGNYSVVNVKLTVEYDGTNYHGWQVQTNCLSIQAVLEQAVSTFLGAPTHVTGSGRTDAGVHALGQVANFFTDKDYLPYRILRGLNALTPRDITVKAVEIVDDCFDARRDGRSRLYEYLILNRSTPSPFYRNRAWHIHEPLDVEAMAKAIECLIGEHDFSSFPRRQLRRAASGSHHLSDSFRTARRAAGLHHRRHGVPAPHGAQHRRHARRCRPWHSHARNRSPNCSKRETAPRPVTLRRRMGCIWWKSSTTRLSRRAHLH